MTLNSFLILLSPPLGCGIMLIRCWWSDQGPGAHEALTLPVFRSFWLWTLSQPLELEPSLIFFLIVPLLFLLIAVSYSSFYSCSCWLSGIHIDSKLHGIREQILFPTCRSSASTCWVAENVSTSQDVAHKSLCTSQCSEGHLDWSMSLSHIWEQSACAWRDREERFQ